MFKSKFIRAVGFSVLAVAAMFGAPGASGGPPSSSPQGPFILSDDLSCSGSSSEIGLGDVTFGGASAVGCWGELAGNDWQDAGGVDLDVGTFPDLVDQEGFYVYSSTAPTDAYSGTLFERVAKYDLPPSDDPLDETANSYNVQIVNIDPGDSGTWALSGADANLGGKSFLLAIKAANEYLIWLFAGDPSASSYGGTWEANWGHDISHMSIYASTSERPEIPKVPLPSTLALLALGALLMSRRLSSKVR
ncbi:hypothetical protein [Congregibacter sp.]|uniref:hypothetical protein n=1 Tax=Congregibacter sp. TaxID=2744308 RepID=UPI0039E524AE